MKHVLRWGSAVGVLGLLLGLGGAIAACDESTTPNPPDPDPPLGACAKSAAPENTDERCRNGLDDDCNGYFDCFDFSCSKLAGITSCCGDGGAESSDERCMNGIDDDCDGFTDCQDFDCGAANGVTTCCGGGDEKSNDACSNHWDDDCDGFIDCHDFDCVPANGVTACCGDGSAENTDDACTNGLDDDCNGYSDCHDFACSKNPDVSVCCVPTAEAELGAAACGDGVDQDCDGLVDCNDDDCVDDPSHGACKTACVPSGAETSASACSDGVDQDCDGYIDCVDFECGPSTACQGSGTKPICSACSTGSDCAGGVCLLYPNAPAPKSRFCSNKCSSDADCEAPLSHCNANGTCGSAANEITRTCNGTTGYTKRDGCGTIISVGTCTGGKTCKDGYCEAACAGLHDACDDTACCAGLFADHDQSGCICRGAPGDACSDSSDCYVAPTFPCDQGLCGFIAGCIGGTCSQCPLSCNTSADCCDFDICSSNGICHAPCDPAACHAFCVEGKCCEQHCSGGNCVIGSCNF